MTKVLSTGGLEPSVSRFDSDLPDKNGPLVEWLQYHPVTVCGTGSNPVWTARSISEKKGTLLRIE